MATSSPQDRRRHHQPGRFQHYVARCCARYTGAEEIAKGVPAGTKVVKAFNTTFAGTLVAGQVAGQPLDVLIAGNDSEAKATISQLVANAGLRVVYDGPLQRARQLEALELLHMVVQFTLGTGFGSAVKILA